MNPCLIVHSSALISAANLFLFIVKVDNYLMQVTLEVDMAIEFCVGNLKPLKLRIKTLNCNDLLAECNG